MSHKKHQKNKLKYYISLYCCGIFFAIFLILGSTSPSLAQNTNLALNEELHGPKVKEVASGAEAVTSLRPLIREVRRVVHNKADQDLVISVLIDLRNHTILSPEARRKLLPIVLKTKRVDEFILEATDPIALSVGDRIHLSDLDLNKSYAPLDGIRLIKGPSVNDILRNVKLEPLDVVYDEGETLEETIWNIISSPRIRRSPTKKDLETVKDETIQIIREAIRANRPIEIFFLGILPKFPNPLRSGGRSITDMNNIEAVAHMLNIHQTIAEVYSPGVRFIAVYEGFAFEGIFLHTHVASELTFQEMQRYTRVLEGRIGVSGVIVWEDLQELLDGLPEYRSNYEAERIRLEDAYAHGDPEVTALIDTWVKRFGATMYDVEDLLREHDVVHPPLSVRDRLSVINPSVDIDDLPLYLRAARNIIYESLYERAYTYWALQNVKYSGGERGVGIRQNYPNAIPATVRSARKYNFSIIPGAERVGPHTGVPVWHKGKLIIADAAGLLRHPGRFVGILSDDEPEGNSAPFLYVDTYDAETHPALRDALLQSLQLFTHDNLVVHTNVGTHIAPPEEQLDFARFIASKVLPLTEKYHSVAVYGDYTGLFSLLCGKYSELHRKNLSITCVVPNESAGELIRKNINTNNLGDIVEVFVDRGRARLAQSLEASSRENLGIIIPPTTPVYLRDVRNMKQYERDFIDYLDSGSGIFSDGLGIMRRMLASARINMVENGNIFILMPDYFRNAALFRTIGNMGFDLNTVTSTERARVFPESVQWRHLGLTESLFGGVELQRRDGRRYASVSEAQNSGLPVYIKYSVVSANLKTQKGFRKDRGEITGLNNVSSGKEIRPIDDVDGYVADVVQASNDLLKGRVRFEAVMPESINRYIIVTRNSMPEAQVSNARSEISRYFRDNRATKIIFVQNVQEANDVLSFGIYHSKNTAVIVNHEDAGLLLRDDLRTVSINKDKEMPLPVLGVFAYADGLLDLNEKNAATILPKLKNLYIQLLGGRARVARNPDLQQAVNIFDDAETLINMLENEPLKLAILLDLLLPPISDQHLDRAFILYKLQELEFLRSA